MEAELGLLVCGLMVNGCFPTEMIPIDDARALFEVNFWGAVLVSRATIKFFREVNEPGRGGVLLQSSSLAGFAGPPAFSIYAARFVRSAR